MARDDGLARKKINLRPRCRASSTLFPAKSSEFQVIARYGGLKYPTRHEWSELQLIDRKVAGCGSLQPQCSTFSLRS
jgi:hypothetical protein